MPLKTTLEQIEEVQEAITAVMSGQSYTINGRMMTKANLEHLNDREEMLLKRFRKDGNVDLSTQKTQKAVANVQFS